MTLIRPGQVPVLDIFKNTYIGMATKGGFFTGFTHALGMSMSRFGYGLRLMNGVNRLMQMSRHEGALNTLMMIQGLKSFEIATDIIHSAGGAAGFDKATLDFMSHNLNIFIVPIAGGQARFAKEVIRQTEKREIKRIRFAKDLRSEYSSPNEASNIQRFNRDINNKLLERGQNGRLRELKEEELMNLADTLLAGEMLFGREAFAGKNVLLVTLEMAELLYAQRICTNATKIPMRELKQNGPSIKHAIAQEKGKIFIKEFPPSTITPSQLKGFIKKFQEQGIKLDAIVLDYLNLLHSPIGSNSYERVKYVTEQVRAMSYLFDCPIISATQLNRSGFDQDNPDLNTVSESIGLAATADCIVSIYQSEEDREMDIIRLGMMKNRFGIRGVTQAMRIDYNTLSIEQADDVDLEEAEDDTLSALVGLAN